MTTLNFRCFKPLMGEPKKTLFETQNKLKKIILKHIRLSKNKFNTFRNLKSVLFTENLFKLNKYNGFPKMFYTCNGRGNKKIVF